MKKRQKKKKKRKKEQRKETRPRKQHPVRGPRSGEWARPRKKITTHFANKKKKKLSKNDW
jgi:hypothetical protein